MKVIHVSGTRKKAIARATVRAGVGTVRVNSRLLRNVQPEIYRMKIQEPLMIAGDKAKEVNINIKVHGGGMSAQADAIRTAIAKALSIYDKKLHKDFLDYDRTLIVPDVRQKETHKPNCHGKARSKRQKSYR